MSGFAISVFLGDAAPVSVELTGRALVFANQGSGPSPAFTASVLRQPDGFTIDSIAVSALGPGQQDTVRLDISFDEIPQVYELTFTADSRGAAAESDEGNHSLTVTVEVIVE